MRFLVLLLITFGNSQTLHAAASYALAGGGTVLQINEHGQCRRLTNNSGSTYFIGTNNPTDWTSAYTTPPSGVSAGACPPACSGANVAGYCWYFGGQGQSCDTVCASHGGYHAATQFYSGNGGSDAQCIGVMDAVGVPGGTFTGSPLICGSVSPASGCAYYAASNVRVRCNTATTTSGSSLADFQRICACNN